jgi:uncharacterized protein YidB (DUF937 family)
MSILSTLAGALEGAANLNTAAGSGTASSGAMSQIIDLIQQHPGGLGGLLQSLQQGGLGHVVQSWIGSGQNLPVSADQLRNSLPADWLARLSQLTGLSHSEAAQQLSAVLPQIVDHLTPNGQLPQGGLEGELANLAQQFLRR